MWGECILQINHLWNKLTSHVKQRETIGTNFIHDYYLVWHAMTQIFLRSENQDRDTLPKTRRRMIQGWKSLQMMTYNTVWEVIK